MIYQMPCDTRFIIYRNLDPTPKSVTLQIQDNCSGMTMVRIFDQSGTAVPPTVPDMKPPGGVVSFLVASTNYVEVFCDGHGMDCKIDITVT